MGSKLIQSSFEAHQKASFKLDNTSIGGRLSNPSCLKVYNPKGILKINRVRDFVVYSFLHFPFKHHPRGFWLILRLSMQANVLISSMAEGRNLRKGYETRISDVPNEWSHPKQTAVETQTKQEKSSNDQWPFFSSPLVLEKVGGGKEKKA